LIGVIVNRQRADAGAARCGAWNSPLDGCMRGADG
jgi:hypothetical protein